MKKEVGRNSEKSNSRPGVDVERERTFVVVEREKWK